MSISTKIDWNKVDGLVPAIIQDDKTLAVLMLGYMNLEALQKTLATGQVTFYSRSKLRLWTKGESSGHYLMLKSIKLDCDQDTLIIAVDPIGPTCHLGSTTCFGEPDSHPISMLATLSRLIQDRAKSRPQGSYTTKLFESGTTKIAQKLGEEGVETALAAACESNERLCEESADLIFHLLVLLEVRGLSLNDVTRVLEQRHQSKLTQISSSSNPSPP